MRKLALSLLLASTFAGCSGDEAPAGPGGGPPGAGGGMPVEAEELKAARLAQEITAVGSLRSDESITVSSEIAGRIDSIHFVEGQPAERGQLLFKLDDSIYQAELEQARATMRLTESDIERNKELVRRNLISARDSEATKARLEVDRAGVSLAEARLAKTRIRAPFSGVVGLRHVSPGDYIAPGQALASLESLAVLKADFRLAEVALPAIKVGQELNLIVDAYPGEEFEGTVYAIDPRLSEESRSIGVRARVPNKDGRLRPGLFARVKLVVSEKADAVTVPEQAIIPQGQNLSIYVIEDGKAAIRPVTIGNRSKGRAEILTGVKEGDVVITAGFQKIGPGAPVMPINLQPSPSAEAGSDAAPAAEASAK